MLRFVHLGSRSDILYAAVWTFRLTFGHNICCCSDFQAHVRTYTKGSRSDILYAAVRTFNLTDIWEHFGHKVALRIFRLTVVHSTYCCSDFQAHGWPWSDNVTQMLIIINCKHTVRFETLLFILFMRMLWIRIRRDGTTETTVVLEMRPETQLRWIKIRTSSLLGFPV